MEAGTWKTYEGRTLAQLVWTLSKANTVILCKNTIKPAAYGNSGHNADIQGKLQ